MFCNVSYLSEELESSSFCPSSLSLCSSPSSSSESSFLSSLLVLCCNALIIGLGTVYIIVRELLLVEVALELLVRRGIVTVIKETKSFS